MIVRWPGQVTPASESDHVGYFGDVLATAAAIAGIEPGVATDGINFLPAILGQNQQQKKHTYLYWEFYERGSVQAVRMGNWKGVAIPMGSQNLELFNLENDLSERKNVAADHPDVIAQMQVILKEAHEPSALWKVRGKVRKR